MKKFYYLKEKIILMLSILIVGSMISIHAQNGWEQLNPMSNPKAVARSCVIDMDIYVFGGYPDLVSTLNVAEVFNTSSNERTTLAPMPVDAYSQAVGFINDTAIILSGGWHYSATDPHWVTIDSTYLYNPEADSWQAKKECPKNHGGSASCVLEGKLYLFGGAKGTNDASGQDDALVYDPVTDTWDTIQEMSYGRYGATANAYNGEIYIFGGSFFSDVDRSLVSKTERYDPGENTWTELPDLPVPVDNHLTVMYENKFYLFGGTSSFIGFSSGPSAQVVQEYDPLENQWQLMKDMPFQRSGMTGQIAGDTLYVMGGIETLGESSSIVSEVWKFNLDSLEPASSSGIPDMLISDENFRIFPNPTDGPITIHSSGLAKYCVNINSLNGKLLYSKKAEGSSYQFDISSLQKGVYLITIRSEESVTTRKIVKL